MKKLFPILILAAVVIFAAATGATPTGTAAFGASTARAVTGTPTTGTSATAAATTGAVATITASTGAAARLPGQETGSVAVPDAVRSVLQQRCVDCHTGDTAPMGLRLDAQSFPASALGVASRERPELKIIDPSDPAKSYLLMKIEGDQGIQGNRMPPTGPLTDAQLKTLRGWILGLKAK